MFKAKLFLSAIILAVASLLAFLPDNHHSAQAMGNFATTYATTLNTTAAGGAGHTRTDFAYTGGASQLNFSSIFGLTPPDVSITPGQNMPLPGTTAATPARIVGQLSSTVSLGLLNAACFVPFTVSFSFRNADTDIRDTIAAMPEGSFNRLGNLRMDLRGPTAGSGPNGAADYLDAYPSFLNELFDPADSDVTGVAPVYPLRPLARYAGDTAVAGTDVILQFLVFGRGALTQFTASGPTNPLPQITDDFGYASVTVLQDPTATAAPSTITDFCAPFSSTTYLAASIDPEVFLVSSQCDDPADNDTGGADGSVNDGCPRIARGEVNQCIGTQDGLDDDGDGVADDGCGAQGGGVNPAIVGPTAEDEQCADAVDGSDGAPTAPAYTEDIPADGAINDGCPAVATAEDPAEAFPQCAGALNDEAAALDAAAPASTIVNDGCPISGPAPESGAACAVGNVLDEDGDGDFNDGCPASSGAVGAGLSAARIANPPAATGLYGTNTHLYMSLNTSFRDADGDGFENQFDTCPFAANVDDARVFVGADSDNIDPACDPDALSPCGPGVADDAAITDCDLDGFMNAQDNCPLIPNPGQVESETFVPQGTSSPDSGPATDALGDPCDPFPTVATGHYHSTLGVNAVCFAPGVDTDLDGWCDATETTLGSAPGVIGSTPENIGVDFALPLTSAGATPIAPATAGVAQTCNDGIDNDGGGGIDGADAGCTAAGIDGDADGVCNASPAVANCVLMVGNGAALGVDNCPTAQNPNQENTDFVLNAAAATVDPDGAAGATVPAALPADTLGNACDDDDDNDSFTGGVTVTTGGATTGTCRSTGSVNIFRDCIENYLGTTPFDNCPASTISNNEAVDSWPVDLNDSSVVDGLDTSAFTTAQTGQNVRADFNGDLSVNLFDLSLMRNLGATGTAFFTKDCSPP